ncbi:MAG: hypothetical protein DRP88_04290 [Candidatus Neomarinimicrobiota bacterium]|nr:MAG: hypothetical protein DRP88_04290 [Candidatus Neomarinimicrobiota bacterium]
MENRELEITIRALRAGLKNHIENTIPEWKQPTEGKMLRGTLVLLINKVLGKENADVDKALDLATAIEAFHTCSLNVDDALDDDDTRRGKKALYLTMSKKEFMLNTIYQLAVPYGLVAKYGRRYVEEAVETQKIMSMGVLEEIKKSFRKDLPASSVYKTLLEKKTGALFSLAAKYGAMSATEIEDIITAFSNYGMHLGLAYQIADDITDLSKVITGEKKPGTEMLLLKCLHIDELVKELIQDIKTKKVKPSKALELLDNEELRSRLLEMVDKEIKDAITSVLPVLLPGERDLIISYSKFCVTQIFEEAKKSWR